MSLVLDTRETLSLDALAEIANREHVLVEESLSAAVVHAFAAGDALNRAFALVPEGEWAGWFAANFKGSDHMGRLYRRMSTYRDELRANNITTVNASRRFLAEAQLHLQISTVGHRNLRLVTPLSKGQIDEIRALRKNGLSHRKIAHILGISKSCVGANLDPLNKQKRRRHEIASNRRKAIARRAIKKMDTASQARRIGGPVSKSFAVVRQLTAVLDQAIAESSGERAQALSEALHAAYRAEDAISRAIRSEQS